MAEEPLNPATTVTAAFNAANPNQALESDDPRYVDFTAWRSPMPIAKRLATMIQRTAKAEPPEHVKILFTGHKGSGKSTELRRLAAQLEEDGFFVVFFDAATEIDMGGVSYADVLLSTMYNLVATINASDFASSLNDNAVDALRLRLAEITVEHVRTRDAEVSLESTIEGGGGIPGLFKVLSSLKSKLRGGESEKTLLRDTVDGDIGLFLEELNDLIRDLQRQLHIAGSAGLVILVDSLDRIILKSLADDEARTTHRDLFVDHAEHLMAPACSMVYTIPVSLLNNQNVASVWGGSPEILPMVKVHNPDGTDCAEALNAMVDAVDRRMSIETLFENPNDVVELCRMSGGHLRHLMMMLRDACSYTADGDRVSSEAVQLAVQNLVNDFQRTIEDQEVEALLEVHRTRRLPNREECASLPLKLLVLEYRNGSPWNDVHPAAQKTALFQNALAAATDGTA